MSESMTGAEKPKPGSLARELQVDVAPSQIASLIIEELKRRRTPEIRLPDDAQLQKLTSQVLNCDVSLYFSEKDSRMWPPDATLIEYAISHVLDVRRRNNR